MKKKFVYDMYLRKAHEKGEVDTSMLKQYTGATKKHNPPTTMMYLDEDGNYHPHPLR